MWTLTRKDFLKAAGLGAVGALSMGAVAGCSPAANSTESLASTEGETAAVSSEAATAEVVEPARNIVFNDKEWGMVDYADVDRNSWRVKPEPITDFAETIDVDACVVGFGWAGASCARELVEAGKRVLVIEEQPEDNLVVNGHNCGHINSELTRAAGIPDADPVEFYNNWMLNCNNQANPTLVMKYAQNGSDADWFYNLLSEEQLANFGVAFWPQNDTERSHMLNKIGNYRFYPSVTGSTEIMELTKNAIREAGSDVRFGCRGVQLIQNDAGEVTGVVGDQDGQYIQINCPATIICTGGFGSNASMVKDLMHDLVLSMKDGETVNPMGMDRDGRGIQMAYWAGAQVENEVPSMNGRSPWIDGLAAQSPAVGIPQGIFLNYQGKRFCNEFWAPIEQRSSVVMNMPRDLPYYGIFDSNLVKYMEYVPPTHGTVDPTPENLAMYQGVLDEAAAAGTQGAEVSVGQEMFGFSLQLYSADTLEELVECVDADDAVKAQMVQSIKDYNEMVKAGVDQQFGRDPEVMFPIDTPPYFLQLNVDNNPIGNYLVTVGGLHVDGDQRVYGENFHPIPGLFASGNPTSGRFGKDYFSPIYGASVGMCVVLGRQCGKSVEQYLDGTLI